MARILTMWRINPSAPWPTDPSKYLELMEKMWAGIDEAMKKGDVEEMGAFPEGHVGYTIARAQENPIIQVRSKAQTQHKVYDSTISTNNRVLFIYIYSSNS